MMEQIRKILMLLLLCFTIVISTNAQPDWSVNVHQYEYSMTLTSVVSINNTLVENTPGVIVGAFDENSNCVGVAEALYYNSVGKYRVPLMIHSNQDGVQIHLKVYIPGQDSEFDITNGIQFQIDGSMGNFVEPEVLSVESGTVIIHSKDDLSQFASVYPNPVVEQISVQIQNNREAYKIMLYNLTGQLLKEQICNQEIESMDVRELIPGTYFLKVESKQGPFVRKIIKK